jgi:hypothetical protein
MAVDLAAPDDVIGSELWNQMAGLLNGTTGYGNPIVLQQLDSSSVYQLTASNIDATNGLAAKFSYGPVGSATTLMTVAKAAITVGAPITPASGSTISMLNSAGQTLNMVQTGYTQNQVFVIDAEKRFDVTGTNTGSAVATFNQTAYDRSTNGADLTSVKIVQHWTGSNATATATGRGLEIEVIRYAATSLTGAVNDYGLSAATPTKYGSTRGIAIGLGHDSAITDPAVYTYGLVGVDISNVGAFTVDLKADGTGGRTNTPEGTGNKGTTGVNIWGASGFLYGIIYSGTATPNQLLTTTTGRIFHVAETVGPSGTGIDQMWLSSANTSGTGFLMRNTSSGTFQRSSTVQGSGGSLPGAWSIWNHDDSRYMLAVWKSLTTSTIDQVLIGDGSAAVPTLGSMNDIDTGLFWQAVNTLSVTTGGTEALRVTSGQLLDFRTNQVASGTTAIITLGNYGGAGRPTAAAQAGWQKIKVAGTDAWVPYWQ